MIAASSSHGFDSPVSLFLSVYFAFTVFVASSPTNSGFSSTIVHSVAPTMPASCTSVWIPEAKTVTGAVFDATMTTDIVKAASFLLSLITTSPFHRISITEHQKFKKRSSVLLNLIFFGYIIKAPHFTINIPKKINRTRVSFLRHRVPAQIQQFISCEFSICEISLIVNKIN